jgi:hypothetical protein
MKNVGPAKLARWQDQPALFVRELFGVEPDAWQEEVLAAFPKVKDA